LDKSSKIRALQKILEKSSKIKVESSSDSEFKSWKNSAERTLIKVFGTESTEYKQFSNLKFFYQAMIYTSISDYTVDHLKCFRRDMKILKDSINEYIEELQEELDTAPNIVEVEIDKKKVNKIFISHASKDALLVEEVIELLEAIGIDSNQIFCTSFEGYGIELGENFLEAIKDELSSDTLVLFILSKNFYESPVCMCEMGATWVLSKEHIPVVIPPMNFEDIKGVIPLTQGLMVNDTMKLNTLKTKLEQDFAIENPMIFSTWERKRDRVCNRIIKILEV
jgi:hypothetical protein